jgi:threonylcarbamoyladenosine tRNA methylthiotransferase MtaB
MNITGQQEKKIAVTTLRCKVNQFESAVFISELAEREVELTAGDTAGDQPPISS